MGVLIREQRIRLPLRRRSTELLLILVEGVLLWPLVWMPSRQLVLQLLRLAFDKLIPIKNLIFLRVQLVKLLLYTPLLLAAR